MTKAADGTTRVIAGASNILPKGATQQSLIKVQPGQQLQLQNQGAHFIYYLIFCLLLGYVPITFSLKTLICYLADKLNKHLL